MLTSKNEPSTWSTVSGYEHSDDTVSYPWSFLVLEKEATSTLTIKSVG